MTLPQRHDAMAHRTVVDGDRARRSMLSTCDDAGPNQALRHLVPIWLADQLGKNHNSCSVGPVGLSDEPRTRGWDEGGCVVMKPPACV